MRPWIQKPLKALLSKNALRKRKKRARQKTPKSSSNVSRSTRSPARPAPPPSSAQPASSKAPLHRSTGAAPAPSTSTRSNSQVPERTAPLSGAAAVSHALAVLLRRRRRCLSLGRLGYASHPRPPILARHRQEQRLEPESHVGGATVSWGARKHLNKPPVSRQTLSAHTRHHEIERCTADALK